MIPSTFDDDDWSVISLAAVLLVFNPAFNISGSSPLPSDRPDQRLVEGATHRSIGFALGGLVVVTNTLDCKYLLSQSECTSFEAQLRIHSLPASQDR